MAVVAAIIGVTASPAAASNVTITKSGPVSVEFTYSSAFFVNTMRVTSPVDRDLFNTAQSQIGIRVGLGNYDAGTTFVFQLRTGTNTWSSDPSANSDGQDHMRVTELRNGDPTLDDRVFKLEWEDDVNLGDRDFNDAVAILRIGGDTDGDGLYDDWERFGIDANNDGDTTDPGEQDLQQGVDQNGNGSIEPNERADPLHKDIFIEMDWMDCSVRGSVCSSLHSHKPYPEAIAAAAAAFRGNRSVSNPDGTNGINVHIDVSNAIPEAFALNFDHSAGGCLDHTPAGGVVDFDDVKARNFDHANVRRFAYHYALSIHADNLKGNDESGCAELPGNDFYISFGLWASKYHTIAAEAGTILHELGHNLGLKHGGDEDVPAFKPNYVSIMNYSFQVRGIPFGPLACDSPTCTSKHPAFSRFDYSGSVLPGLVESNLEEKDGIQDGGDYTFYFCPSASGPFFPFETIGAPGPIDWNCDGQITRVITDINDDGQIAKTASPLHGFNDWPVAIQGLPFQTTGDFADGSHTSVPTQELDQQTAVNLHLLDNAPIRNEFKHAEAFCKADRAFLGEQAFEKRYGANGNAADALGKCISQVR